MGYCSNLLFFVQVVYFICLQWSGSGTACRGRVYKINKSALIAAEQRIGELLLAIPKATPNNNPFHEKPDGGNLVKSKSETIKEMGYGKNEAADYQQMAKNPEVV